MSPEYKPTVGELSFAANTIQPVSKWEASQALWEEEIAAPREALRKVQQNYADERLKSEVSKGVREMVRGFTSPLHSRVPGMVRSLHMIDWEEMEPQVLRVLAVGVPSQIPDKTQLYKDSEGKTHLQTTHYAQHIILPRDIVPGIAYYGLLGARESARGIAMQNGVSITTIRRSLNRIHNVMLHDEAIKRSIRQ